MPAPPIKTTPQIHTDKYAHLESEVAGLKADLGGVRADVRVLNESYHALERTVSSGFDEIKDSIRSMTESRERKDGMIPVNTLIAVIGVVLPTLGLVGGVAMLMLSPINAHIADHALELKRMQSESTKLVMLETMAHESKRDIISMGEQAVKDSQQRHSEQQIQIDRLKVEADGMRSKLEQHIESQGGLMAEIEWLKHKSRGEK